MILFALGAPASLNRGEAVCCCFFFLSTPTLLLSPVPALLFGGNVSDSCFLRELPIPGNSESLPRGALRRYCFIPHPHPTPIPHEPHKHAPRHRRCLYKGAKEMQSQKGFLRVCCVCVNVFLHTYVPVTKKKRKPVWFSTGILFNLEYNRIKYRIFFSCFLCFSPSYKIAPGDQQLLLFVS